MSEVPSTPSIGSALAALDTEIEALTRDADQLYLRLNHIATKLRVCHEAITGILISSNGGTIPLAPDGDGRFPELNHKGD